MVAVHVSSPMEAAFESYDCSIPLARGVFDSMSVPACFVRTGPSRVKIQVACWRSSAPVRSKSSLWQRFGSTRPGVLLIGRVVSPLQRRLIRATDGRFVATGKAPVLLVTTRGRRTGQPRTVPLFYLNDGDRYVVCNVNPGFEQPNPWTLNLRADGRARVEVAGSDIRLSSIPSASRPVREFRVPGWPAPGFCCRVSPC